MANYSQHHEDQKLEEIVLKCKIYPLVIDVGAGDGLFLSNSRKFITEYGFKGIMIEPSNEPFIELAKLYWEDPNVETLQVALAEKGGIEYILERGMMDGKGHWTLDRILRTEGSPTKTETLSSVLKERSIKRVGLLSVDTEGYDTKIIEELIKNSEVRPDIIITETLNQENTDYVKQLLESDKYYLADQIEYNLIFLLKKHEKDFSRPIN